MSGRLGHARRKWKGRSQRRTPLPGGALLFCPGVDPSGRTVERAGTAMAVTIEQIRRSAEIYLAGHPHDDPIVNPLSANLAGLPPMLVQAGTGDFVLEEAQALAERARSHGVDARLELYPVATHGFQIFWSFLPEAADAMHQAGRFVRERPAAVRARARSST